MVLDAFIILFMVMSLWKIKPVTLLNDINNDFLSPKTCNSYKGFFAVIVLLHHLSQRTSDGNILRNFTSIGYLAVSVFFFFSGYGLQKKHLTDSSYKNGFLVKRIPSILIPYAVMTLIYWLLYAILGDVRTLSDMWTSFIKYGDPLVWFSWYVVSIMIFYVAFYVLMKIFKQNKPGVILGSIIYYVLYVIACRAVSFGPWWYMTSFIPIIGIIFASYEKEVLFVLKKISFILTPLIWISFIVLSVNEWHIRSILPKDWSEVIFSMMMSALFVLGIVSTSARFKFGNKILNFLGNISFELYMVQGLFMMALRNDYLYIANDTVWSLLVIFFSILSAFGLNKLFKLIILKYKKLITAKE